jgi:hypothetical protein
VFYHSHSLFCVSHSHVLPSFYVLSFPFSLLAKLIPIPPYHPRLTKIKKQPFMFCHSHSSLPAKAILIPPYSPRLAKIKKTHMFSKRFEPMTSQAKAKSSYRYTTCVFMYAFMIGNTSTTSLTKLTCYPCTMRSSR